MHEGPVAAPDARHKSELVRWGHREFLRLVVAAVAIAWNGALAQETTPAPAAERAPQADAVPEQPTAPIVVDGVELFRVRGVAAYPAAQRAAEIAARIRALGANRSMSPDSIKTMATPLATFVYAGDSRILGVTDADAQLEGLTPAILAEVLRRRVVEAVVRFRQDREPGRMRQNVTSALVATIALVLFLTLGTRVFRALRDFVHRKYHDRVRDVRIQSLEVVRGEQLWAAMQYVVRFAGAALALLAAYVWLNFVLLLFPGTRAVGNDLSGMLLRPLATMGIGIVRFIPNFIFLAVLVMVARFALRFNRAFFQRVGSGQIAVEGFDSEWSQATEKILRFMIVVFALIIAYPYIPGSGSEAFKGIGLLLGLMFSLGSPSVIGNLVAGLSLAFRRAFRIGDRVKIGEHSGFVSEVRLLTTYIRSFKNEQIVIPNSIILNSEVVNYTTLARDQGIILHSTVGIGYETPWRQVEAMLLEAAHRTTGIEAEPAPFIRQKNLGTFAVEYEINGYCNDPPAIGQVYTALHRNILDLFNEHGVQIMTPAYEGDPQQPKVVPKAQWYASPAKPVERIVEPLVAQESTDAGLTTRPDDRSPRNDGGSDIRPG